MSSDTFVDTRQVLATILVQQGIMQFPYNIADFIISSLFYHNDYAFLSASIPVAGYHTENGLIPFLLRLIGSCPKDVCFQGYFWRLHLFAVLFTCRCHRQFALFGFNRETSAVLFETNAIYGFVLSSIYSLKKQMPVFKGQLFISI
jgi:hypothetical protein